MRVRWVLVVAGGASSGLLIVGGGGGWLVSSDTAVLLVVLVVVGPLVAMTSGETKSMTGAESSLVIVAVGRTGSGLSKTITIGEEDDMEEGWAVPFMVVEGSIVPPPLLGNASAGSFPPTPPGPPPTAIVNPPLLLLPPVVVVVVVLVVLMVGWERDTGPIFSSLPFSFPTCGSVAALFLFLSAPVLLVGADDDATEV